MEHLLTELFDYQKFEKDPALEELIRAAEKKYPKPLSMEELEQVTAAGVETSWQSAGRHFPGFSAEGE